MVGDENLHAQTVGFHHAIHAGNAVIYRDQNVGIGLFGEVNNLRRQAVTVFKTIRHDEPDLSAESTQTTHRYRAGGRTITVIIGDDQQLFACRDCIR